MVMSTLTLGLFIMVTATDLVTGMIMMVPIMLVMMVAVMLVMVIIVVVIVVLMVVVMMILSCDGGHGAVKEHDVGVV
mgnify:CR=1 FL=1